MSRRLGAELLPFSDDSFKTPDDIPENGASAFTVPETLEDADDTFHLPLDAKTGQGEHSAFELDDAFPDEFVDDFQRSAAGPGHYRRKRQVHRRKRCANSLDARQKVGREVTLAEAVLQKALVKARAVCEDLPEGRLTVLERCSRDFFMCGHPVRAFRCENPDFVYSAANRSCMHRDAVQCGVQSKNISLKRRLCKKVGRKCPRTLSSFRSPSDRCR